MAVWCYRSDSSCTIERVVFLCFLPGVLGRVVWVLFCYMNPMVGEGWGDLMKWLPCQWVGKVLAVYQVAQTFPVSIDCFYPSHNCSFVSYSIWLYTCFCRSICLSVSLCYFICIRFASPLSVFISPCLHIFVCLYLSVYVSVSLFVSVSMAIIVSVLFVFPLFVSIYLSLLLSFSGSLCGSLSVCLLLYLPVPFSMSVSVLVFFISHSSLIGRSRSCQ